MTHSTEKLIAKANKQIKIKETIVANLIKFLQTDKGTQMVRMIGFMPLKSLITRYGAPDVTRIGRSPDRQMNLLMHAVVKAGKGLELRHTKIIDYTGLPSLEAKYDKERERFVKNWQKDNYKKHHLSDDDIGELIKKTVIHAGLGLAAKLYGYQQHKMAKWDKRAEIEKAARKKSDLFPDTWDYAYKQMREAQLEQLRNDLCHMYVPAKVTVRVETPEAKYENISITSEYKLGLPIPNSIMRGVHDEVRLPNKRAKDKLRILTHNIEKDTGMRVACVHMDYAFNKNLSRIITLSNIAA